MIQKRNIKNATHGLTPTLPPAIARRLLPTLMLTLTLLSVTSGCRNVKVIAADQMETFVHAGQVFTAPDDGVYMNHARYQRYRRAVVDRNLEFQTKETK